MTLRLGWFGFALAGGWIVAYYAYTPGGLGWLERGLRWPRRLSFGVALALSMLPLASGGTTEPGGGATLAPFLATLAATGFALWRQWLWLPRARPASPHSREVDPSSPVVVLPGGDALLFDALPGRRVVRVGDAVIAHCSLAGSVAAFQLEAPVRPSLPLGAGFEIAAGARRWDAIDGRARDGGPDTARVPISICTERAWRARFPRATLFSAGDPVAPRVTEHRFGVYHRGEWRPLTAHDLDECPVDLDADADRLYLSLWAAQARGLV